MKNSIKYFYEFAVRVFGKYQFLALLILAFIAFFGGTHTIFNAIGYDSDIRKLKNEIQFYEQKIEEDKVKLLEFEADNEEIEKFAREQYYMKQKDEDIFIVE